MKELEIENILTFCLKLPVGPNLHPSLPSRWSRQTLSRCWTNRSAEVVLWSARPAAAVHHSVHHVYVDQLVDILRAINAAPMCSSGAES